MRLAAVLIPVLAFGCATAPLTPQAPPPFSSNAQTVEGELAVDQDGGKVSHFALSDEYVGVWAENGPVHFALRTQGDARLYIGGEAVTETVLPMTKLRRERFWVVSESRADSSYQLVIDPPPAKLAAPPRNDAASRREQFLKLRPLESLARPHPMKNELDKFALDGTPVAARLEAFAGMELGVEADHCYRLLLRLGPGAQLSEVAQRGLELELSAGEQHADGFAAFSGAVLSKELCASDAGTARLTVQTKLRYAENELGSGPLSVEVYKRPDGPFAESAAARDRAIAKETRGFAPVKTVSARLESFKGFDLPLRRGGCYAMVVKLGPGARFSPEVRHSHFLSFGLETADEDGSAGPGAIGPGGVGVFNCRQKNEKGRFKLTSGNEPLGTGPVTVQILSKTASEAQLRREAAEDRAERIASTRRMEERQAESCKECIEEKISCHRRGASDCYESFLTCVRSKGYAESTCGG